MIAAANSCLRSLVRTRQPPPDARRGVLCGIDLAGRADRTAPRSTHAVAPPLRYLLCCPPAAPAHAAHRPGLFRGVVNFVGGWLGEDCGDAAAVNRAIFLHGATSDRPTLWLYGENDPFYSLAHSRGNFDTFVGAGGLVMNDPSLWTAELDAFVKQLDR
jgi:hypothetical protein